MVSVPAVAPDRSIAGTLRTVETVVWSLGTLAVAVLLAAVLAGAVVVTGRPVGVPPVVLLGAVVVGTVVFVLAEVASE
jgi:hypothetical protein